MRIAILSTGFNIGGFKINMQGLEIIAVCIAKYLLTHKSSITVSTRNWFRCENVMFS